MKLEKETLLCDLFPMEECEEDEKYGPIQVTGPYRIVRKDGGGVVNSLRCYCDE
jgi:hypothetical protein